MFNILNMTETKTVGKLGSDKPTLATLAVDISRWLNRRSVIAGRDIEGFKRNVEENAVDALINASEAVIAAGKKSVLDEAISTMQTVFNAAPAMHGLPATDPFTLASGALRELSRVANIMLLRLARDVSADRSPLRSMVHAAKTAQWAEIAENVADEVRAIGEVL